VRTADHDGDALRARLAAVDPARGLAPVDPAVLALLVSEVVEAPSPHADVTPIARRRTPTTWLVAAAAAVVIAGAGGYALTTRGDESAAPSAGEAEGTAELAPPTPGDDGGLPVPGTTVLAAAPAAGAGRCATLTAELLAGSDEAFAATVTGLDAGTVTLQTTEVFAGEVGQTVQVEAPRADLQALVSAARFENGGSYLVAATDGLVSPCGWTGKATAQLQAVYDQAFVP
jgi:hypothetical protein